MTAMSSLRGKVVFITGGARGVGAAEREPKVAALHRDRALIGENACVRGAEGSALAGVSGG